MQNQQTPPTLLLIIINVILYIMLYSTDLLLWPHLSGVFISFYENNITTDSVHVLFTKHDFPILNSVISQFSDLASFYDLHLSSNLIPKTLNVFLLLRQLVYHLKIRFISVFCLVGSFLN